MRRGGMHKHYQQILKIIKGMKGSVNITVDIVPRFDYGAIKPWTRRYWDYRFTWIRDSSYWPLQFFPSSFHTYWKILTFHCHGLYIWGSFKKTNSYHLIIFLQRNSSFTDGDGPGYFFYIHTSKRMEKRITEICLEMKQLPLRLIGRVCDIPGDANILTFTVHPDEKIALKFGVKYLFSYNQIYPVKLVFSYKDVFKRHWLSWT